MNDLPTIALIIGAIVLLTAGLFLASARAGKGSGGRHRNDKGNRPAREAFRSGEAKQPALKRAAVVLNPTKVEDLAAVRSRLNQACVSHGWAAPLIFLTTEDDPGYGQAKRAVDQGVDIVCALGGDGTVRAVGEALSSSGVPMGLLPGGTGNLLARNLDLPYEDLDACLEIALTGRNRHIDVGWLEPDGDAHLVRAGRDPEEDPATSRRQAFLVMAGIGFDAELMQSTSEELKAKVGWGAYVASGLKHLRDVRFRTRMTVDGGEPVIYRARTIVVGNCGKLQGGITLMPDAVIDDGLLDVVAVTPRTLAGWVGIVANVMAKREASTRTLDRYKGTEVVVAVEEPQKVQLDGDAVGEASQVTMTVQPAALIVRVAS